MKVVVEGSDLLKVRDALQASYWFFKARDEMNAQLHLAREVRYSPITVQVEAELERLQTLLSTPEEMGGWRELGGWNNYALR